MELHRERWIGNERDESSYGFDVLSRKRIVVVGSIMKSKNWWRDGCRLVI